jgi:hypothetical protein
MSSRKRPEPTIEKVLAEGPMSSELLRALRTTLQRPKAQGSGEWRSLCPFDACADHQQARHTSFTFNEGGPYYCHRCGEKGHIHELPKKLPHLGLPSPSKYQARAADPYADYLQVRGVSKATLDKYGVSFSRGEPKFPYPSGATKQKNQTDYFWAGDEAQKKAPGLFGAEQTKTDCSSKLWIVEGESDALAFAEAGISAISLPAGAKSVKERDIKALKALKFEDHVILYDKDRYGLRGGHKLREWMEADGLKVTLLSYPQENVTGYDGVMLWNDVERKPEAFKEVLDGLSEAPSSPEVWDAIKRPLYPEPSPLPLDALVPVLRAQAASVAASIEVPPDVTVLLSVLSVSAAIGGKIELLINESWTREWCVLYGIVLLATGERKSPAFEAMTDTIKDWEEAAMDAIRDTHDFKVAMVEVQEDRLKQAKRGVRQNPGDNDAKDELEAALKDLRDAKEAVPNLPRLLVDDATVEALVIRMAGNEGRAALLSAEGGALRILNGLYSEGSARLEEVKKAWSGESIITDRVGREGVSVPRPALTLGLCCQPSVLNDLSKKRTMRDEGFFGRVLSVSPKSLVGKRNARAQPPRDMKADKDYTEAIHRLLDVDWNLDKHGRKIPWPVRFSAPAVDALLDYQQELEPEMAGGRRLGGIPDWGNKAHAQAARIAALQTMADRVSKGEDLFTNPIGVDAVNDAVRLVRSLTDHALHVLGLLGADRQTGDLTYVLSRRRELGEEATIRDLFRAVSGSHIETMEDLEPLVNELVDRGYFRLKYPPPPGETGGRPASPIVLVNPAVYPDKTDKASDTPSSVSSVEVSVGDASDTVPTIYGPLQEVTHEHR